MAALVLDVGNWFHTKRRLQGTADAAALAGAQQLPDNPGGAQSMALSYANQNGGDVAGANITVTSTVLAERHDQRQGRRRPIRDSSAGVLGIASANIDATREGPRRPAGAGAVRRADGRLLRSRADPELRRQPHADVQRRRRRWTSTRWARRVPSGCSTSTGGNGTPGASEEADWILKGFDKYLRPRPVPLRSGRQVRVVATSESALDARIGTVLLFPVFKTLSGNGQNAEYDIIGWIGFHLTSWTSHGHTRHAERLFHANTSPRESWLQRRQSATLKYLGR